jgi:hypothetical protein
VLLQGLTPEYVYTNLLHEIYPRQHRIRLYHWHSLYRRNKIIGEEQVSGLGIMLRLLLFPFFVNVVQAQSTSTFAGQGGTPWAIPFGMSTDEQSTAYFGSALVYDAETDRIYVTGVSSMNSGRNIRIPTADDDQSIDDDYYNDDDSDDTATDTNSDSTTTKSDCFLGILQVPRRSVGASQSIISSTTETNSNAWIRQHTHIGTYGSQEACSGIDIVRRGNDRKVYLIGHSVDGPSLLAAQLNWYNNVNGENATRISNNNSTNSNFSSKNPVVYGFVMDVTWYNANIPTGYLMHQVSVEYPIGIATSALSSSDDGDIFVASIQSLSGIVNPAHSLYQMTKNKYETNSSDSFLYDTTTSGAYEPPEYGETFSFHLRRIGERSQSKADIMTLPEQDNSSNNSTLYDSKVTGSTLMNLLKLSNRIKSSTLDDNGTYSQSIIDNTTNSFNETNSTFNASATNTSDTANDVEGTPLSYDEYRFVVERWGRTFLAEIQENTSKQSLRSSVYSVQVSSLLRCTVTVIDELYSNSDDDTTASDDDSTTFVQRRQDIIIVAGSTRGSGLALGGLSSDTSLHGFVSSFDTTTGVLLRTRSILTAESTIAHSNVSDNTSRDTGYTVRVLGMCQQDSLFQESATLTNRPAQFFYVVGMTDGSIDHESSSFHNDESFVPPVGVYQAFIQKIDIITLSIQWTKQIGAATFSSTTQTSSQYGSIHGISCAVTPDGLQVYMGGTVINGAAVTMDGGVTNTTTSFGYDDMFVAQYMTADGEMNYVKQIGTAHDDTLANGVSLITDKYGNAVLLGNTRGAVFDDERKKRNLTNEVVLLSIDRRTGAHVDISGRSIPSSTQSSDSRSIQPTLSPVTPLNDGSWLSSWMNQLKTNVAYRTILGFLTFGVLLSIFLSICSWRRRNKNEKLIARYIHSIASENNVKGENNSRRVNDTGRSGDDREHDIEQAKLFSYNDADVDVTEISCSDECETVSFVSTTNRCGPPSLVEVETSSYSDTMLHFDEANRLRRTPSNSRTNSFRGKDSTKLSAQQGYDDAGDDPLHRWLRSDR